MNRETLYEALSEIQDQYIMEADPAAGTGTKAKIRRLRPVISVAAALAVTIGLATIAIDSGWFQNLSNAKDASAPAEAYVMTEASMARSMDESAVVTEETSLAVAQAGAYSMAAAPTAEEAESETEEAVTESVESGSGEEVVGAGNEPAQEPDKEEVFEGISPDDTLEEGAEVPAGDIPDVSILPATILWNQQACTLVPELYEVLPAEFVYAGTIGLESDAVFHAEDPILEGAAVYVSGNSICVTYGAYYVMYVVA